MPQSTMLELDIDTSRQTPMIRDDLIRDVCSHDHGAIRALVRHAFGRTDEADLIERLRGDGDVLVELVAATDTAIQGHVLYSRLAIERGGGRIEAAALAPVAVLPAFQ